MDSIKNLYIFTGKGGVGKTTLSFAFAKHLINEGRKVKYIYFQTSSLTEDQKPFDNEHKIADQFGITCEGLDLKECAKEYVSRKLKSETIGKWVIKTPFFKALINMIPGFNYLIYLGKILDELNSNPDLTIILDSPSSGHALTMLEATHNFSEIFQSGLVFEDTKKMIDLMFKKNFLQVNILTIPTLMALHESEELNAAINKIASIETKVACNNSFFNIPKINDSELPSFLAEKIKNESEAVSHYKEFISSYIPHTPELTQAQIIKEIVPSMKSLV